MSTEQTQPQPELPPPERPRDISGMLTSLNLTFVELERYVAGYNTLTRVYQTVTNTLPPGSKPKGFILSFKGSTDDIHMLDVNVDIQKNVDPTQAPYLIVPLVNGQAMGMLAAINQLLNEGNELKKHIEAAMGIGQQTSPPQPAAKPA